MQTANSAQPLSIVYFGSGPLAAKSLAYLHSHFVVEAVITKPRAPHHKGSVPVIEYCKSHDLRYFTPATKSALSDLFATEHFASQLGVVIDYGIIINRDVIDAFPLGIVNSHFSLLPEWRGADPITFAILSGQSQTGVSLMLINERMDEGPLLAQSEVAISETADIISLTEQLIDVSNVLLSHMLPLYVSGNVQLAPQTSGLQGVQEPSYSRKLSKDDGILDWYKAAAQLEREVRAFKEWPKSRTTLGTLDVIITAAHVEPADSACTPGDVAITPGKDVIRVGTAEGYFCIDRLKPAGKKEMTAAEYIRGYGSKLVS